MATIPSRRSSVLFQVPAGKVRRRDLRKFAFSLQTDVAEGRDFVCLITSDGELRRLNTQFRGKNQATDVLSFPSNQPADGIGEMAISFDRALEQSGEEGHPVEVEIRILMLHGVLHLIGMDHESDHGEMARAEWRWRKRFQLPMGLIERVGT